jgi:myosin heavy subunit
MLLKAIQVPPERYQLGLSKVFLRAGQMAVLDKLRLERLNAAATSIQKNARRMAAQRSYRKQRQAAVVLQAWARGKALPHPSSLAGLCGRRVCRCLADFVSIGGLTCHLKWF